MGFSNFMVKFFADSAVWKSSSSPHFVVLYYIVYGSYVWYSLYNNIRCIRVVMCVNAMWMGHHWFMHIETHPRLGKSHTRASTIVIIVIIHNTFDVHTTWQLFLTPPPKMGRSPRDNNFAICARIVWAVSQRDPDETCHERHHGFPNLSKIRSA